jgi:hypothetical protein
MEGMTKFVEDIPVGRKGGRWGLALGANVHEMRTKGSPLIIKQSGSGKPGLVTEYLVNKGAVVADK